MYTAPVYLIMRASTALCCCSLLCLTYREQSEGLTAVRPEAVVPREPWPGPPKADHMPYSPRAREETAGVSSAFAAAPSSVSAPADSRKPAQTRAAAGSAAQPSPVQPTRTKRRAVTRPRSSEPIPPRRSGVDAANVWASPLPSPPGQCLLCGRLSRTEGSASQTNITIRNKLIIIIKHDNNDNDNNNNNNNINCCFV